MKLGAYGASALGPSMSVHSLRLDRTIRIIDVLWTYRTYLKVTVLPMSMIGEIRAGVLVGPTLLGGFISNTLFPGQLRVGAARDNPAQSVGTRTYS